MFTIHYRNYMRTSWRRAWDMQRILHFRVTGLIFADSTGVSSLVPASFSSTPAISWANEYLRVGKIEKERKRNIRLFIYLFIYDRDIRGLIPRAKTCREAIPPLAVGIPPILYDHASEPILWGKKKKEGGKKREHPRRGEGLTNSTWLRPAIYSRFKGCAGEFYYSAAEFANLFNDLFAMTNSK